MEYKYFFKNEIELFSPAEKIGLLATINDNGLPHITIISTIQAINHKSLAFGQFSQGESKKNIINNHKIGFLMMTIDKHFCRGNAEYSYYKDQGTELEMFNEKEMFRYNAYFGINRVYYMNLIKHYGLEKLNMKSIIFSSIKTLLLKFFIRKNKAKKNILNYWSYNFLKKISNLKFISYIDENGYPLIIPVIQAQAKNKNEIIFNVSPNINEFIKIKNGTDIALFCMSLNMEDILVRGIYRGIKKYLGIPYAVIEINWVYNPMPPVPKQIYPEIKIKPVEAF